MDVQTEPKSTLKELAEVRAQTRSQVSGKKEDALPEGADPIEAKAEEAEAPVVASAEKEVEKPAPQEEEPELIKIGDQVFKNQSEAFAYAEKLEQEKLLAESYNQGVREALQASQKPVEAAPQEDNFEEQFYSNPKETLKKIKEEAKAEALAVVDAREREERAWNKFCTLNPDLADSRGEVMRILQENWEVLGKMRDEDKAMKILATKTRSYFDSIIERRRPRTELPSKPAQVVSPAGSAPRSVTPVKKDDAPLTMAQQLKRLRGRS